jgi:hypothetical protein
LRELTKSMLSFSWAMSLFGLKQMSSLLAPGGTAASGFDAVRRSSEEHLGSAAGSAFRMGDELQRRMVDTAFGLFEGGVLDPAVWLRAASGGQRGGCCGGQSQEPPIGWGPMPPVG